MSVGRAHVGELRLYWLYRSTHFVVGGAFLVLALPTSTLCARRLGGSAIRKRAHGAARVAAFNASGKGLTSFWIGLTVRRSRLEVVLSYERGGWTMR